MRKPNYRFERSERDRTKQAKKEEKARRQQEKAPQEKSHEADQPVLPIMRSVPTTKRRDGELTGPRQAKCIVTITERDGVETLVINDVEPRGIADGNYTLTVKGLPTSRWKRDKDGWERLGTAPRDMAADHRFPSSE
jgi:hypothetical protein